MADRLLTLIRHASTEVLGRGIPSDHSRNLTLQGKQDVKAMASHLVDSSVRPDLILSSDANRAVQTQRLLTQEMELDPSNSSVRSELYLAEPSVLVHLIQGCDSTIQHLAVIAHNPGLAELWEWLTGIRIAGLPTCGVVLLDAGVENWDEIGAGKAKLIRFVHPGSLEASAQ
ncbi:MAG: hypothetical protein CL917_02340 [Deltaproteobacteria bacterium]|nr:hypothetical protein [Deltaproteobacteria bacterium]